MFTNQLVYSSKGFFLHLQVITYYNNITFWRESWEAVKTHIYSVKISRIVKALSNFSERLPDAGLGRTTSSPWKKYKLYYLVHLLDFFPLFDFEACFLGRLFTCHHINPLFALPLTWGHAQIQPCFPAAKRLDRAKAAWKLDMFCKKQKTWKDWWTEMRTHRDRDYDIPYPNGQWSEGSISSATNSSHTNGQYRKEQRKLFSGSRGYER